MATISAILSGSLGFFLALAGYFLFHLTALQALALWSGTGLAFLAALMVLAQLPRGTALVRA